MKQINQWDQPSNSFISTEETPLTGQKGIAKARFVEQFNKAPWLTPQHDASPLWPSIQRQLALKRIDNLDMYFIERLMREWPEAAEQVAFLVCHLFLAAKEGHLCIQFYPNGVAPSVESLWNADLEFPLQTDEAFSITQSIQKGFDSIHLDSPPLNFKKNFIFTKNSLYFHKHWKLETRFLQDLKAFIQSSLHFSIEEESVANAIKADKLNLEQQQAVRRACIHPLSIISGGPGTGKTYTAGRLIRLLWEQLSIVDQAHFEIIVAAPTGKAAANLQKSLTEATQEIANFPKIQSKTLHSLLDLNNHNPHSKVRLNADLLIVDESSMVDLKMMSVLFHGLKKGSRVVLIGDHHQLPSIEAGNMFADLISIPSIPQTELKECLRAELKSIIDLASIIKSGDPDSLINFLRIPPPGIMQNPLNEESRQSQRAFIDYAAPLFPSAIIEPSPDVVLLLLKQFQSIRILSPTKKGLFGVDSLNTLIWQDICSHLNGKNWVAIPILITTNDYKNDLYNGETGILIKKLPLEKNQTEEKAYFPCRSSSSIRSLPALLLPPHEMAYCLSVHKSQGSEFDRVILVMPSQTELLGRELFYTAVTRAKKQIDIFASNITIIKSSTQQQQRLSGIPIRFHEISS